MVTKHLQFKKDTTDKQFKEFWEMFRRQGVLQTGDVDKKWVTLIFENEIDYLAWCVANGLASIRNAQKDGQ